MKKLILGLATAILMGCGATTKSSVSPTVATSPPMTVSPVSTESTPAPAKSTGLPALPAGWQWISGVQTRIAVPTRYVGGSPENLGSISAQLPETGMDEATLAELLRRYVGPTNLFAIDRTTLTKAFPTNLSVALDGKPKVKDLDSYLDTTVRELAGDWQVQQQEKIMLGDRQFGRILATAQKSPVTGIFYVRENAGKFWLLTCTIETGEAQRHSADFQKIAESLP